MCLLHNVAKVNIENKKYAFLFGLAFPLASVLTKPKKVFQDYFLQYKGYLKTTTQKEIQLKIKQALSAKNEVKDGFKTIY